MQTFTEKRSVVDFNEPFAGATIVITGNPPDISTFQATPKTLFENENVYFEIPNTSRVEVRNQEFLSKF